MKKICSLLLAVIVVLMAGCVRAEDPVSTQASVTESQVSAPEENTTEPAAGQTVPETVPTEPEIIYEAAEAQDLAELFREAAAEHKALLEIENPFEGFEEYLVYDPGAQDISVHEGIALKFDTVEKKEYVTYEQAVEDIETAFRVCRVVYGAYYYFGAENFENAKAEILQWLEGQETVSVANLELTLREKTAFMRDGHSSLGSFVRSASGVNYEYYRCLDQQYSKDELGYYKEENGTKWYFDSFSSAYIRMEPSLRADGMVVYEPVLFTPDGMGESDTVTVKNAAGETRTEALIWQVTVPFAKMDAIDYRFLRENDIAYISIRGFNEMDFSSLFQEFMQTGKEAGTCEAVIFDLRSNTGGNGWSMNTWVNNFSGVYPTLPEVSAERKTPFQTINPVGNRSVYSSPRITSGSWIPNDIPIIVLVDDYCASAGERAMNLLRLMDNVLVVGSNTAGCQLGGNTHGIRLPNSGIQCVIGTELRFTYDMTNRDCMGYEPDIWCNPATSLEAVLSMLEYYSFASEETVESLYTQLDGIAINRKNITLQFLEFDVQPGGTFGSATGDVHYVSVYVDGVLTDDFTVESDRETVCTCTKVGDGRIQITVTGVGASKIRITYDGTVTEYEWIRLA